MLVSGGSIPGRKNNCKGGKCLSCQRISRETIEAEWTSGRETRDRRDQAGNRSPALTSLEGSSEDFGFGLEKIN